MRKVHSNIKQEAQLTLTNPHDAFSGQSRSSYMVPFDMLDMVSYYWTFTRSDRRPTGRSDWSVRLVGPICIALARSVSRRRVTIRIRGQKKF